MPLLRSFALGLCLTVLAVPAGADLWRWTDAAGIVRYTPNPARVPQSAQGTLARVEPGMTPAATVAAAAPAPPASPTTTELFVPADEFSFEADPFNAPDQARTLRGDEVPEPLEATATAPLANENAAARAQPAAEAVATPTPAARPRLPNAAAAPPVATASPETPPAVAQSRPTPPVATAPPVRAPSTPATPKQRARRNELEAQIARDEARLKTLISSENARAGEPTAELRAIAARLPELQAELRELEAGGTSSADTPQP